MGKSKFPPVHDPAKHAARVAAIFAEVAVKRAAGIEIHGCDFPVEPDGPVEVSREDEAEARKVAQAFVAKMRAEAGGHLFGDPMSSDEREYRMAFRMGQMRGVIPADEVFVWNGPVAD